MQFLSLIDHFVTLDLVKSLLLEKIEKSKKQIEISRIQIVPRILAD